MAERDLTFRVHSASWLELCRIHVEGVPMATSVVWDFILVQLEFLYWVLVCQDIPGYLSVRFRGGFMYSFDFHRGVFRRWCRFHLATSEKNVVIPGCRCQEFVDVFSVKRFCYDLSFDLFFLVFMRVSTICWFGTVFWDDFFLRIRFLIGELDFLWIDLKSIFEAGKGRFKRANFFQKNSKVPNICNLYAGVPP